MAAVGASKVFFATRVRLLATCLLVCAPETGVDVCVGVDVLIFVVAQARMGSVSNHNILM